jgi:hypothetical protein
LKGTEVKEYMACWILAEMRLKKESVLNFVEEPLRKYSRVFFDEIEG